MSKIRKTIKTRERVALAGTRGEYTELVEVVVPTFRKPRSESEWIRLGRSFCDRQNVDFIRFTGEPKITRRFYEMDITDFMSNATLVEHEKEMEE